MTQFSIYISNEKKGTCRDICINAKDASSARIICETSCLRENEVIFSVYPTRLEQKEEHENKFKHT